jgi:TPP-dependent pyruvate/acetoin dehydrogenase alpha subunit
LEGLSLLPSNEVLIEMYNKMVLIRRFEEKICDLFAQGKVPGWVHPSIGQEAVPTGIVLHLQKKDYVVATHRGHGYCLLKGVPLDLMMAEIFGKRNGVCKGRGGDMHIIHMESGLMTDAIVGATMPIAVGFGIAAKLRGEGQVVVCCFGDGASNRGSFHESLNMAAVWKLPIVFACENNLYAQSTSVFRTTAVKDIAVRSGGYNMPGLSVDGNDVLAVYDAAGKAIDRARRGEGPTLLEFKTYRWHGHYYGEDWSVYRSKEEVEEWKQKCPIKRFREKLMEMKLLTEDHANKIDQEIVAAVDKAIKFAMESPEPTVDEVFDYLYASES